MSLKGMLSEIIVDVRRDKGSSRPTLYQHTLRNVRIYAQLMCRFDARCQAKCNRNCDSQIYVSCGQSINSIFHMSS